MRRVRLQLALNIEAIETRERQVEDHCGGRESLINPLKSIDPVLHRHHRIAVSAQDRAVQVSELRVILDDQDCRVSGGHKGILGLSFVPEKLNVGLRRRREDRSTACAAGA